MTSAFGKILLLTGNAEFLAERTKQRAVAAIKAEADECEVAESVAGSLGPSDLAALTSPSLFSTSSAVVITDLQDLAEAAQHELLAYAGAPPEQAAMILVQGTGQKGKGLLDKLRALPTVHEVKHAEPKYERDYARWVLGEVRDLGGRIAEPAATLLVAAVGQDLRALAGAADQLVVSVPPGSEISTETVRRYFGGRADVRGYEIADAAIDGRLSAALEQTRWAEDAKVAPVLITSAVATGLRSLARLADAPGGLSQGELARQVGVPPFKLTGMRKQLGHWSPAALAAALDAAAQADLDVKGGASDPAFAVERLVLQVCAARGR